MAFVLKIECQGQTHRMPLALPPGEKPNWAMILNVIDAITPRPKAYVAKYTDEDGDLCTLIETTFSDFLETALEPASNPKGSAILKLKVLPVFDEPIGPAMAPVATDHRLGRRGTNSVQARSRWEEDPRDLDKLLEELGEGRLPDSALPHSSIPSKKRGAPKARKQNKLRGDQSACPSQRMAQKNLKAVVAENENQLDKWPKQDTKDEQHAWCDPVQQRDKNDQDNQDTLAEKQHEHHEQGNQNEEDNQDVLAKMQCTYFNQVEHPEQGDQNEADQQDELAEKQHAQCNQVEHHQQGSKNDEHKEDTLAEKSPDTDLQLWPSTPEDTPPSTPRHPQPAQQIVWVPVLMQFASNSTNMMEGLAPPVPWVSVS